MCRRTIGLAAATLITLPAAVVATPATAGVAHRTVVSANPANHTPHVEDGFVKALALVGTKVIVGGNFSSVRDASGHRAFFQENLFAFDLNTGEVEPDFAPSIDGTVWSLAPGPRGTVYVGGSFREVNGAPQRGLTQLYVSTGDRVGTFRHTKVDDGMVQSLAARGSRLYIGGTFTSVRGTARAGIARLDTRTGAVDRAFTITPSRPRAGKLKVNSLALNPRGTRLVIAGTFLAVNGRSRAQIAMVDTAASPARLTRWHTGAYAAKCMDVMDTYMRGIDFSPDGKFFVVVTTGGHYGKRALCDTAARWETYANRGNLKPTWVNYTGGDSLYAVAVTGAAVYVGGHQRWLNNPDGRDRRGRPGKGAVVRPGIGAISARTGRALSWNPTRNPRGHGVEALLAFSRGLLVGSDTEYIGHEYHARVAVFPL